MMKKREQAVGSTGAAVVLQPARAALLVCALGAKFVASRIAAARPVLTSQGTLKFKEKCLWSQHFPIYLWVIEAPLLPHFLRQWGRLREI